MLLQACYTARYCDYCVEGLDLLFFSIGPDEPVLYLSLENDHEALPPQQARGGRHQR